MNPHAATQDLFNRILDRVRDFDRLGLPRSDLLAWKLYPSHPSFAFVAGIGCEDLPDGARLLVAPWRGLLEVLDAIDHELVVELHTPPANDRAVWFAVGLLDGTHVTHAVRSIAFPPSTVKIPEA